MSELKQNSSQQVQHNQKIVIENKVEGQNAQIVNYHHVQQKQQKKAIVSEWMNHQLINQEQKFEETIIKQTSQIVIGHKIEQEIIQIDQNKEAKDAIQDVQLQPQTKNLAQINHIQLHNEQKNASDELQIEKKEEFKILEQKEDFNLKISEQNIQKLEEQNNISDKAQKNNIDLIDQDVNQPFTKVNLKDKNIIHAKAQIVENKFETQQEMQLQYTDVIKHNEEANQLDRLYSDEQKHQQTAKQVVAHQQQTINVQVTNQITNQQQFNQRQQQKNLTKVNQEQPNIKQEEKQCVYQHNPPVDAIASQQLNQTIELQDKKQLDLFVQNPKEQVINPKKSNLLNQIKQNVQIKFDQVNKIKDQDNNLIDQDQKTKPDNAQAMLEQSHPQINEQRKNIQDNEIKKGQSEDLIKIEQKDMNQQLLGLPSKSENKSTPNEAPQLKEQNSIHQFQQNIAQKVDLQQKNTVQVNILVEKNGKQQSQNIQQVNQKSDQQKNDLTKLIDKQYIVPTHLEEQTINQNQKNESTENHLNNFTQKIRSDQINKYNQPEKIAPEAYFIEQKAIVHQQKQEKYQLGNQLKEQSNQLMKIQNVPNQSMLPKQQLKNDHQRLQITNVNNHAFQEAPQQEKIEQKPVQSNQNNQFQNRQAIQINILKIQSDQQCLNKEEPVLSQENIQYVPDPKLQRQQKSKEAQVFMGAQNKQEKQIQQLLKNKEDKLIAQNQNKTIQKVKISAEQDIIQQPEQNYKAQMNQQPKNSQIKQKNYTFNSNQQQIHAENIDYSCKQQNVQRQQFHPQKQEIIEGKQDVNKEVVEFIEFNQQEKIKLYNLQANNKKEVISQVPIQLKSQNEKDTQNIIAQTPSKDIVIQKQSESKTKMIQQQISQKKTPIIKQNAPNKEGVGRIARKIISEKRVHDVIQDLKKYQQKGPRKQSRPSSRRRKLDIAKADHISIKSNIISVTIGQILSKEDDHMEADKLLNEIDQLKKKLFELEKRREMSQQNEEQRDERPGKQTLPSNKSNKKLQTGKIYRRSDSNNSRVTEEVQTFGYESEKNNFVTISSGPRQRFSSTQDFSVSKSATKQGQIQNKTGPILFRVKKNNKNAHGPFDFNLNEKEIGIIKYKDFDSEDKCFQAKRQDAEKLQFNQQEKLNILQKPSARPLHFEENFRQQIEKYFINLGNELPKRDWSQEQLVEIARQTFKKFGINIQAQKNLTLSVKKYKNCVSFVLDSNRTILWYYEGKFYFGGWKTNRSGEGEKNGWGYDYSPGKYVFSGYYIQNKRDGYGVIKLLTRQHDVIYQGGWKNGLKHGEGKQKEPDRSQYIGEWAQGKKNGKGIIKGIDQEYFEGSFLNGVKNVEGIEIFKNGDSYEGNYYDGKFHGIGVYTWANQSKYEGQFKEGSRNGNGTWVSNYNDENSDIYEGQYRNDRKNGYGIYRWKDGTVYEGQFLNDLKHGQGIVSYGDGKSTKLQWFEGNVVPKQNAEKQRIGGKRSISKSSSKKGEQKNIQKKAPLIKFNIGNESRLKPTRMSLGIQQI